MKTFSRALFYFVLILSIIFIPACPLVNDDDDDDDDIVVQFSNAATSSIEGVNGTVRTTNIAVNLTFATAEDVEVSFVVNAASTAVSPNDFTISASPLVITSGNNTGNIVISTNGDNLFENQETVIIDIVGAVGVNISGILTHTHTINDFNTDHNGNGVHRFPFGTDFDDDGDGVRSYFGGGIDFDDTDANVQNSQGNGTFGAATVFAIGGTSPNEIFAEDFNGDGKLDLATSNTNSNNVSILLGAGNGTFGAATEFAVSAVVPRRIFAGDFNGDGNLDLATSNFSSNNVSILLGAGNGTFGASAEFAIGGATKPLGIFAGDFNGDGKLDLATPNFGTNNVSILLGN